MPAPLPDSHPAPQGTGGEGGFARRPGPRHGRNYHQWLSAQYGLKKLVEHLWMLVGMARACDGMRELREKMAEQFGRQPVQLTLFAPPPSRITHKRQPPIDHNDVSDGPGE